MRKPSKQLASENSGTSPAALWVLKWFVAVPLALAWNVYCVYEFLYYKKKRVDRVAWKKEMQTRHAAEEETFALIKKLASEGKYMPEQLVKHCCRMCLDKNKMQKRIYRTAKGGKPGKPPICRDCWNTGHRAGYC